MVLDYTFNGSPKKSWFPPSFGAKKGTTKFYQFINSDGLPVAEIEMKESSFSGKPEIMSAYTDIRGKGLGERLVKEVLDIYLVDNVFVRATKESKGFWVKMGAVPVDGFDGYFLKFTR